MKVLKSETNIFCLIFFPLFLFIFQICQCPIVIFHTDHQEKKSERSKMHWMPFLPSGIVNIFSTTFMRQIKTRHEKTKKRSSMKKKNTQKHFSFSSLLSIRKPFQRQTVCNFLIFTNNSRLTRLGSCSLKCMLSSKQFLNLHTIIFLPRKFMAFASGRPERFGAEISLITFLRIKKQRLKSFRRVRQQMYKNKDFLSEIPEQFLVLFFFALPNCMPFKSKYSCCEEKKPKTNELGV